MATELNFIFYINNLVYWLENIYIFLLLFRDFFYLFKKNILFFFQTLYTLKLYNTIFIVKQKHWNEITSVNILIQIQMNGYLALNYTNNFFLFCILHNV